MTTRANDAPPLRGLIMAGGRSARMGRDKSALEYGGKSQLQRCGEILARLVESVHTSVRPDQADDENFAGLSCIADRYADAGPMSGVMSALDHDPESAWLVLACDLPLMREDALRQLVDARDPARMVTTFMGSDGFLEPLCAIYEPRMAAVLRNRLEDGLFSLRDLLSDSDVKMVCAPDDRILTNVNTPAELEQALLAARELDT